MKQTVTMASDHGQNGQSNLPPRSVEQKVTPQKSDSYISFKLQLNASTRWQITLPVLTMGSMGGTPFGQQPVQSNVTVCHSLQPIIAACVEGLQPS
jgi:hypothetical protein